VTGVQYKCILDVDVDVERSLRWVLLVFGVVCVVAGIYGSKDRRKPPSLTCQFYSSYLILSLYRGPAILPLQCSRRHSAIGNPAVLRTRAGFGVLQLSPNRWVRQGFFLSLCLRPRDNSTRSEREQGTTQHGICRRDNVEARDLHVRLKCTRDVQMEAFQIRIYVSLLAVASSASFCQSSFPPR
jgi:hypothetical protein